MKVYKTDNYTLYNEDCIKVMKTIKDKHIDLIVTDPPYLISYKTNHRKYKHDFETVIQGDDDYDLIANYIKECYRILKDDSAMYMFCSFDKVDFFKQELEKYFTVKNMIIWVKNNWTAGDLYAQFGKQYEIIFLVNKGRKEFNGARITDVWNFDRISGTHQVHQNQKPLELILQCIEKHSKIGDIIFDGFMGSGTTGVASKQLDRKFIGCEIEEKYFNVAKNRIQTYHVKYSIF